MCLSNILSVTINLSRQLQKILLDRAYARNLITNIINTIKLRRENATLNFESLFKQISKLCNDLEFDVNIPRLTQRQRNRANPSVANPEEYYRISVYIPLLDNIINNLTFRFSEENMIMFDFSLLVPSILVTKSKTEISRDIKELSNYLRTIEGSSKSLIENELSGEIDLLLASLREKNNLDQTILLGYQNCDKNIFPRIKSLLQNRFNST